MSNLQIALEALHDILTAATGGTNEHNVTDAARRDECAVIARAVLERLGAARGSLEAAERNCVERKHVDATPNEDYPLRILRAYRADCDMRWSLSTTNGGQDATPLMEELNAMQDQRAAILNRAIAALAASPTEAT